MNKLLEELYSLRRLGVRPGIHATANALDLLDRPDQQFPKVLVSGTNGKGSTLTFLASILQKAGYKVGRFTSPHLVEYNERIVVGDERITYPEVEEYYNQVREACRQYNRSHLDQITLTFFEYTTVIALLHFAWHKIDIAVMEIGLGGRLDATNAADPIMAVITPISFDHTKFLGNSLTSIAREKCGILRQNIPVISGPQPKEAIVQIELECKKKNNPFYYYSRDFKVTEGGNLTYSDPDGELNRLTSGLKGEFQIANMATAIKAARVLKQEHKYQIDDEHIKRGCHTARWPGRLEIIQHDPLLILDGAHNLAAAKTLTTSIKRLYPQKKIKLLVSFMRDKKYQEMLKELSVLTDTIYLTRISDGRALDLEILLQEASQLFTRVKAICPPATALQLALDEAQKDDLLLCAGSLYLVGELRREFIDRDWPGFPASDNRG